MIRIWIFTCAMIALTLATRLQAASLAECAAIEDDQQRLACFDEAARAPAATQPAASSAAEAIATPVPVFAPAPVQVTAPTPVPTSSASISGTPANDNRAAAAIVPAPAQATAAAQKPLTVDPTSIEYDELFGLENQVSTQGKQQIQSRIMNQFDGWNRDTIFELENGQVWKQSDNNSTFFYRGSPQPVVTIKKGYFGSFQLRVDGFNKRVKVKRVK